MDKIGVEIHPLVHSHWVYGRMLIVDGKLIISHGEYDIYVTGIEIYCVFSSRRRSYKNIR